MFIWQKNGTAKKLKCCKASAIASTPHLFAPHFLPTPRLPHASLLSSFGRKMGRQKIEVLQSFSYRLHSPSFCPSFFCQLRPTTRLTSQFILAEKWDGKKSAAKPLAIASTPHLFAPHFSANSSPTHAPHFSCSIWQKNGTAKKEVLQSFSHRLHSPSFCPSFFCQLLAYQHASFLSSFGRKMGRQKN